MPLYEYECEACGGRFELIQKFSDPSPDACRTCGKGPVRRLLSSPAIQFKGSGWYITDYARKGSSTEGSGKSSAGESSGSTDKGESTPKSEPKSQTSTAPAPATTTDSSKG